MKKTLFFLGVTFLTFSSVIAQFYSNPVFKLEIPSTTAEIILKFDFEVVSPSDSFDWQLILAKVDESLDCGRKIIAYQTAITPNSIGLGNQTLTFDVFNDFEDRDVYTWEGKINLGANSFYFGKNIGNLDKISSKASANDFENPKSSVFPNPSSAFVNISSDYLLIKNVKIFNVIGEKIAEI
jgi:hypothetical protein